MSFRATIPKNCDGLPARFFGVVDDRSEAEGKEGREAMRSEPSPPSHTQEGIKGDLADRLSKVWG